MLNDLSSYANCIVFIDDIINVDVYIEERLGKFSQYRIRQFTKAERYNLIKNWIDTATNDKSNGYYRQLDEKVEIVESTLGKIFGNGIMPSYPFFVLSAVILQETAGSPLDQEITSQGYCYQALVYFYLRRAGVKNDEVDTYINVMSVVAMYIYRVGHGLNEDDLDSFFKSYEAKYNLPISKSMLLKSLSKANLFDMNNLGSYDFTCKYLSYFFTAKYVAEHFDFEQLIFAQMVNDIHIDMNAYILIFIAHHTKKTAVVDSICQSAMSLLSQYSVCKLTADELKGFERQLDVIMKAVLPKQLATPESARRDYLAHQDEVESQREVSENAAATEDTDIRKFIRLSEVLGRIAKNRAGSFERDQLAAIIRTQLNMHARFISNFIEVATDEKLEKLVVSLVDENLEKVLAKRQSKHDVSLEARKKLAKMIFWNINFWILKYSIGSCISAIGSKKLRAIIDSECDNLENCSAFTKIVKYGIHMWNCKELDIEPILEDMTGWSEIAKRLMRAFVVDYCVFHKLDFTTRQQVERRFELSPNSLLQEYEMAVRK